MYHRTCPHNLSAILIKVMSSIPEWMSAASCGACSWKVQAHLLQLCHDTLRQLHRALVRVLCMLIRARTERLSTEPGTREPTRGMLDLQPLPHGAVVL